MHIWNRIIPTGRIWISRFNNHIDLIIWKNVWYILIMAFGYSWYICFFSWLHKELNKEAHCAYCMLDSAFWTFQSWNPAINYLFVEFARIIPGKVIIKTLQLPSVYYNGSSFKRCLTNRQKFVHLLRISTFEWSNHNARRPSSNSFSIPVGGGDCNAQHLSWFLSRAA